MSVVGAIGDPHIPATHPRYLDFCSDVFDSTGVTKIVCMGDLFDLHNISFHQRETDAIGLIEEFDKSYEMVSKWVKRFPKATVCIGNHDERLIRKAASVGIPSRFLRNYSEIFHTPGWKWVDDVTIDNVHYFHGTGHSGKTPALDAAVASMRSTVMGHNHSRSGIYWAAGPGNAVFGLDVGCGVDVHNVAMRYGRNLSRKPILSCAVIKDGEPMHFRMKCGLGEKYSRRR